MPVKWTPEVDQILLLKILETHEISVDPKKIVVAWPSDRETPTARAITERLVKIRKDAKANGAGNFSVGKGTSGSTPTTPRKRTNNGLLKTPTSKGTPAKKTATPKSFKTEGSAVKNEFANGFSVDDEDPFGVQTPSSTKGTRGRSRKASAKDEEDELEYAGGAVGNVSFREARNLMSDGLGVNGSLFKFARDSTGTSTSYDCDGVGNGLARTDGNQLKLGDDYEDDEEGGVGINDMTPSKRAKIIRVKMESYDPALDAEEDEENEAIDGVYGHLGGYGEENSGIGGHDSEFDD
ncbi:MAG: hypothetical protein M1819_006499 [Sarea resinae]|nr:MAG: hypothetical protein M1819_006499 [Sarea resinae]